MKFNEKPTLSQADTHSVVFDRENFIQEMLKRQKMHLYLRTCSLPKLIRQNKITDEKFDKSVSRKYPTKHATKKLLKHGITGIEIMGQLETLKQPQFKCSTLKYLRPENSKLFLHPKYTSPRASYLQLQKNKFTTQSLSAKKYVDKPVSAPCSEQVDKSCSLLTRVTRDLNDVEEKIENFIEHNVKQQNQSPRDDWGKSRKCTEQEIANNDKIQELSSRYCDGKDPAINGFHGKGESANVSGRLSSRLTYTPSTPPLFLSDEIYELPRNISPRKALLELRQSFCENIRKEAVQLEFDLKQLYLKKKLHQK